MNSPNLPLSDQANALLASARHHARRMGFSTSGPAHIVMSVVKTPRTAASYILETVGVDPDILRAEIEVNLRNPEFLPSEDECRVIDQARHDVQLRGCGFVCEDDLLLAALRLAGPTVRLACERLGINLDETLERAVAHVDEMLRKGRAIQSRLGRDGPEKGMGVA